MRGKGCAFGNSRYRLRITPAYAGKRDNRYKHNHDPQDHPRLCGEKAVFILRHHDFLGSPPPMRGKGGLLSGGSATERITPAYAGKRRRFCSLTVAI